MTQNPTFNRLIRRLPKLLQLPLLMELEVDNSASYRTEPHIAGQIVNRLVNSDRPALYSDLDSDLDRRQTEGAYQQMDPKVVDVILTHPSDVHPKPQERDPVQNRFSQLLIPLQRFFNNTNSRSTTLRYSLVIPLLFTLWWGWPAARQSISLPFVDSVSGSDNSNSEPVLAVVNPDNMSTGGALQMNAFRGTIGRKPEAVPIPTIQAISLAPESEDAALESLTMTDAEGITWVADVLAEVEQMPENGILVSQIDGSGKSILDGLRDASGAVRMARLITPIPALSGKNGAAQSARSQPTATPTPFVIPAPVSTQRLWSIFTPPANDNDHFWIERPFAAGYPGQLASPSYQFGSTAGGRYRLHRGLDISNVNGTPLRAGTIGEVVHAGSDREILLGPYNNFYGNTVVIRLDRKLEVAGGALDVYLLYGHLSSVTAQVGQRVQPDDVVGRVGMTGIALGPHLHLEVRLNENSYGNSINPYLWVKPLANSGAVAIRVLTADGRAWSGASFGLARTDGGWGRQIITYSNQESMIPDPAWGENGAMGSVPPGRYYLAGNINGEKLRADFTVYANQTTFVELRTQQ